MLEPWEESWERPATPVRRGPSARERWSAIIIVMFASAGFLVTVVWPLVTALR